MDKKEVLIVVDMQNDFITGSLANKDAENMVKNMIKKLKSNKKDLIFTMDTHDENYLETQEGKNLPIKHCIKESDGWHIIPQLAEFLGKAKYITEKDSFGGFSLVTLTKDYDNIELIGVCTDICVIANALMLKLFYPEKEIIIDKKCCAGTTKSNHNAALKVMKSCQVTIK